MGTEKRQRQRANRQLKHQEQVKQQQRRRLTRRIVIGVLAVVGGVAFVLFLAWAFGSDGDDDAPPVTEAPEVTVDDTTGDTAGTTPEATPAGFAYGAGPCPPEDVDEPIKEFDAAPQQCIDPDATYTARLVTSEGDIVVELDTPSTPGTVNNFVTLARSRYYDDTLIFRTDPSIDIIQGGGVTNSDPFGYTIPDEGSGFTYPPGVLAMANTGAPDSGGAQWFITAGPDAANLDALGSYVVFGRVVEGLDVAEAILALAPDDGGDTPTEEVALETVEITES